MCYFVLAKIKAEDSAVAIEPNTDLELAGAEIASDVRLFYMLSLGFVYLESHFGI